jgi:DNA replication protein DnaC
MNETASIHQTGLGKIHIETIADPKRCKQFTESTKRVLSVMTKGSIVALLGNRGTGKTQLAAEVLRRYCPKVSASRQPIYRTAMDLFRQVRDGMKHDPNSADSEANTIRKFTTSALLVVDECQERGQTDFEDRTLCSIIDRRYNMGIDTILIANLTPQAFMAQMGASVSSRLTEVGEIIVCDWPSFRGQT